MKEQAETKEYLDFYGKRRNDTYGRSHTEIPLEEHSWTQRLRDFVKEYDIQGKRCLEIGSAGGVFQDLVQDYTGTDVGPDLAKYYRKPFKLANSDGTYPFKDESFDVIWTVTVFEHIPNLQNAMNELRRLLRPGGLIFFAPAWQCRTWAADGYPVRPYSDFGLRGKLIKASIPVRDSVVFRGMFIFPKRAWRTLLFRLGKRFHKLRYRRIRANYEVYWMSDADACNQIDAHDAILWFESNGFRCLSHPLPWQAFLMRNGPLVVERRK